MEITFLSLGASASGVVLYLKIEGGLSASEEEHKRGLWHLLCSPHFSALFT
jgi:hypothetical protein